MTGPNGIIAKVSTLSDEEKEISVLFLDPLLVNEPVWDIIGRVAIINMTKQKCSYEQAIVMAYIEIYNAAKDNITVQ